MTEFVRKANLPINAAELLVGEKYADILEIPLKALGIGMLKVPDNPHVDTRLSGHADLSVFHFGENKILLAPYLKGSVLEKELLHRGFSVSIAGLVQSAKYPEDAQMNSCVVGENIILAPQVCCKEIVEYFTNLNTHKIIACKQGYTRCSVCVVDECAIITADRGIAEAAREKGIAVLGIRPDHIALDGFDYGFIGGSSFKISKKRLAFTGTLDKHPDKERILSFLAFRDVEPVYITNYPLFDIGGALPVTERKAF